MHQICTSEFILPNWYNRFLRVNLSIFSVDSTYGHISSSYFSLLALFCILANNTIIVSLRVFDATQFINNEVLPLWQFYEETQLLIDTFTNTILSEFTRTFALVRNATTVNHFVTGSNSNERILVKSDGHVSMSSGTLVLLDYEYLYRSNQFCSCTGHTSNCAVPVRLYTNLSLLFYNPPGLFVGCLQTDSVLLSTLECWFDQSCVNLVRQSLIWPSVRHMFNIMSMNISLPSRFKPKTPMNELMDQLLLEKWIINISYDKFYHSCVPRVCIYTLEERYDIVFILFTVIGIYGSLSKGLRILLS